MALWIGLWLTRGPPERWRKFVHNCILSSPVLIFFCAKHAPSYAFIGIKNPAALLFRWQPSVGPGRGRPDRVFPFRRVLPAVGGKRR